MKKVKVNESTAVILIHIFQAIRLVDFSCMTFLLDITLLIRVFIH